MNRHGFTLIEVLFVTVLIAVLLAAIYPYLRAFHTSWQDADRRGDIIQNARIGMDKMVRELRWAGSFSTIDEESLVTFIDVDSNPAITYRLNSGNLERNSAVLAGPVSTLTFTYYDEAGVETDTAADVKSVAISMTVSDPEGAINDTITLASAAFIRSTPASGVSGEGQTFSKNASFSPGATTFSTTDTFYIKVWSDQVDYDNLDYATCELKLGGTKNEFNLTNNEDGTYTGSQSLSGYATDTWTVNIDVKDTLSPAGSYKPTPAPTIKIQ